MANVVVGAGSHTVSFYHPTVGSLEVRTGIDDISWGYNLNTANYATYGGEVVQILSCYVDDLEVHGTIRNYTELEAVYSYFLNYIRGVSADGVRDDTPMSFDYFHRGWKFKLIVTEAPGYRKARELTVPEWRIRAFIVDDSSTEDLKDIIIEEAQIKAQIGSDDPKFDEHFGLEGKVRFVADNPFSDPFTSSGLQFAANKAEALDKIGNYYSSLIPAYLNGDFDTIFGSIGSKPAFNPNPSPATGKGVDDNTHANQQAVVKAKRKK